jgi:hypothetical protein
MFKLAGSKIVDKNKILARDEANQRQISINLQKKFEPIADAIFGEEQLLRYPNTLLVSNEPTLSMLIASDRDSDINSDVLQSYSLARNQLLTISTPENADFILNRLDDLEIQNLNQKFPSFIETLTKKYKNIDKNRFIELIKTDTPLEVPKYDVTERGQTRLDRTMPESLIRARLTEKKDQITDTERFCGNEVIVREEFEEYQHKVSDVTPKKNPLKKAKSPHQTNNNYSNILNEDNPIPKSETEKKRHMMTLEYSFQKLRQIKS